MRVLLLRLGGFFFCLGYGAQSLSTRGLIFVNKIEGHFSPQKVSPTTDFGFEGFPSRWRLSQVARNNCLRAILFGLGGAFRWFGRMGVWSLSTHKFIFASKMEDIFVHIRFPWQQIVGLNGSLRDGTCHGLHGHFVCAPLLELGRALLWLFRTG